jgi:phospholipid/cholesterol/gamma-HCH transport system substrate-binding protein
MSAPTNRWKLGAFVLGTVLLGLAAIIALTAQTLQVVSVDYTSYFDESVNGLEVGSPVSFRGVKIGNVSVIDVAPDRRHVEIKYQLGVVVLKRLGLSPKNLGKETKITVPPELRVQIASTGLTGTKFLQLDFFDNGGGAPPALPFPVPENYIPAAQSTMKNLEDSIVRAVDQIPEITQQLAGITTRIGAILDDVGQRGLPGKASVTLERANRLMASLQDTVDQLHTAQLSHDVSATMAGLNVTMRKLNTTLDTLNGSDGLFASVQRTSDSLGEVVSPRMARNLDETGRDLREAAAALRQLVEALERDPDMLIKGRAR